MGELTRRKFAAIFNAIDVNDNGVLDRDDFERIADQYIRHNGWEKDSTQSQDFRQFFLMWWERYKTKADVNDDGVVTLDEFVAALESFTDDQLAPAEDMIFGRLDPDGDGSISAEEYRLFSTIYRLDVEEADEIFARLDLNGDGRITHDELATLWMQYWRSEDEAAPGNWLFGRY
jgi:Ca2+-binding EF-hand superfamily protein